MGGCRLCSTARLEEPKENPKSETNEPMAVCNNTSAIRAELTANTPKRIPKNQNAPRKRVADGARQGHSRPAQKGQAGPDASGQRGNRQVNPVYRTSEASRAIRDEPSTGMTP